MIITTSLSDIICLVCVILVVILSSVDVLIDRKKGAENDENA